MTLLSVVPASGWLSGAVDADEDPTQFTAPVEPSWKNAVLVVKPMKTRVSLASVYLEVSALRSNGKQIEGRYDVRVPLKSSENDRGIIQLQLVEPLEKIVRYGGVLHGVAQSEIEGGPTSRIACHIRPQQSGRIELEIDNDDRQLKFESSYHIIVDHANAAKLTRD